ncbi:uncharacterized protein LOC144927671 [Branchiostoma floridae x Branchiostoma belcheri]
MWDLSMLLCVLWDLSAILCTCPGGRVCVPVGPVHRITFQEDLCSCLFQEDVPVFPRDLSPATRQENIGLDSLPIEVWFFLPLIPVSGFTSSRQRNRNSSLHCVRKCLQVNWFAGPSSSWTGVTGHHGFLPVRTGTLEYT